MIHGMSPLLAASSPSLEASHNATYAACLAVAAASASAAGFASLVVEQSSLTLRVQYSTS